MVESVCVGHGEAWKKITSLSSIVENQSVRLKTDKSRNSRESLLSRDAEANTQHKNKNGEGFLGVRPSGRAERGPRSYPAELLFASWNHVVHITGIKIKLNLKAKNLEPGVREKPEPWSWCYNRAVRAQARKIPGESKHTGCRCSRGSLKFTSISPRDPPLYTQKTPCL